MEFNLSKQSTVIEAYDFMESNKSKKWSDSTKRSYRKVVNDVVAVMEERNIKPILENIDFKFVQVWENSLYEVYSEKSIKQKIAVMTSFFKYMVDLNVLTANYFATLTTSNNDTYAAHSRELDIEELYSVYKVAHRLEDDGVSVLLPTLVAMFTGFRNATLTKLKVSALKLKDSSLEFKLKNQDNGDQKTNHDSPNNKIKELIVPLPPNLMGKLTESVKGFNNNSQLLYGVKGKPLANKQMNYITKIICEKLNWVYVQTNEDENESENLPFTPHGFRYTVATLFSEMGVEDQSIRHVLGHSNFERGNLKIYIKSYNKNIRQIRAAQLLLETLFATAFELEMKFNLKLDLAQIFDSIERHYQNTLHNKEYLHHFKSMLVQHAFQTMQKNLQIDNVNIQTNMQQPQNPYMQMAPFGYTPNNQMMYSPEQLIHLQQQAMFMPTQAQYFNMNSNMYQNQSMFNSNQLF